MLKLLIYFPCIGSLPVDALILASLLSVISLTTINIPFYVLATGPYFMGERGGGRTGGRKFVEKALVARPG